MTTQQMLLRIMDYPGSMYINMKYIFLTFLALLNAGLQAQQFTVSSETHLIVFSVKDSALNGSCVISGSDGSNQAEGSFVNGRMSGLWTCYSHSGSAGYSIHFKYDTLGMAKTEVKVNNKKYGGHPLNSDDLASLKKKNKDKVFLFSKGIVRELPCTKLNRDLSCNSYLFQMLVEEVKKNGLRLYRDEQLKEPFTPTVDELSSIMRATSVRFHEQITSRLRFPMVEQTPVSFGLVMNSNVNESKVIGWISAVNFMEFLQAHEQLYSVLKMIRNRAHQSVVVKEANVKNQYLADYVAAGKRDQEGYKAELEGIADALHALGLAFAK